MPLVSITMDYSPKEHIHVNANCNPVHQEAWYSVHCATPTFTESPGRPCHYQILSTFQMQYRWQTTGHHFTRSPSSQIFTLQKWMSTPIHTTTPTTSYSLIYILKGSRGMVSPTNMMVNVVHYLHQV